MFFSSILSFIEESFILRDFILNTINNCSGPKFLFLEKGYKKIAAGRYYTNAVGKNSTNLVKVLYKSRV